MAKEKVKGNENKKPLKTFAATVMQKSENPVPKIVVGKRRPTITILEQSRFLEVLALRSAPNLLGESALKMKEKRAANVIA